MRLAAALNSRAGLAVLAGLVALLLAGLFYIDNAHAQSGAWALVGLSLTVGFAHGALDAALLQRRFNNSVRLIASLCVYLLAVLLLGWWLSSAINLALWLLILMSVWHFGEPYERWRDLQPWSNHLTRVVVGGAPIMTPVWLAPREFAQTLAPVVNALAVQVWQVMAAAWLLLLLVWVLACGLKRPQAARYTWAELLGCAAAYAAFSPLMAFALYFGVYHAPVHMWRVWRSWTQGSSQLPACPACPARSAHSARSVSPAVLATGLLATLLATWLLGAGLWWLLSPDMSKMPEAGPALRWLIVALAAVTAPHLVLISSCAVLLAGDHSQRGDQTPPDHL